MSLSNSHIFSFKKKKINLISFLLIAIQRFHDKRTYYLDIFRAEKLIVAISGKQHQIFLFPSIILEGMHAEVVKIEETKGCYLFCTGELSPATLGGQQTSNNQTPVHLLCVAVRKQVTVYELTSTLRPKYRRVRDIELTMGVQSMQILNGYLCIGFQSEFALYSLVREQPPIALLQPDRDKSLQFLSKDPINALQAVQISNEEYLLVFESKFFCFTLKIKFLSF